MNLLILAALQGITEAFPVSSSAHLYGYTRWFGLRGISMEEKVVLHFGSFLAFVVFFFQELWEMLYGIYSFMIGMAYTPEINGIWLLTLATLPLVGVVVLMKLGAIVLKNTPLSIKISSWYKEGIYQGITIFCLIGFGLLLYVVYHLQWEKRIFYSLESTQAHHFLFLGFFQIFSVFPGVSRLGIIVTAALLLGYGLYDSAFLGAILGIPAMAGALVLHGSKILSLLKTPSFWKGALVSGVTCYFGLFVFFTMIEVPFFLEGLVLYRCFVGLLLARLLLFKRRGEDDRLTSGNP